MRRLWVVVAAALLIGCATGREAVREVSPDLGAQIDTLRSHLHAAGSLGAMVCAPELYAQVHASYRFAVLEKGQGNRVGAREHVAAGLALSSKVLEESKDCPVRGVLVSNAEMDPGADTDGDGLAAADDLCPYALEDHDEFEDTDGCPEPDNDADGVLDADDQCASESEDMDGFEDGDGCPDPDNDADGLLDADDQCAEEAETLNGFEDGDGCADVVPRRLKIADGYIELDAPVQFVDLSSAELLAASHPMLEELAGQLAAYPEMIVRVEGHTSNRGKKDELATRSTARAESVAAFLVAQGLPAAKVLSQGYGGTKPKTTNRTKSGRAANERVEFAVVQGGPTP